MELTPFLYNRLSAKRQEKLIFRMVKIVAWRLFSVLSGCVMSEASAMPGCSMTPKLSISGYSLSFSGECWSLQIENKEGVLFSFCMEYDDFCWKIICEN